MREKIEFRLLERIAADTLPDDVGRRTSNTIRTVILDMDDPLVKQIGQVHGEQSARDSMFFSHWGIRRTYSRHELSNARAFQLDITKCFEPAGEDCDTIYDDAKACPFCGAGAPRTSPLILNGRRMPKRYDIAKTIAGEIVVSRRFVQVFQDGEFTGVDFAPVQLANTDANGSWFTPVFSSQAVDVSPSTRFGANPFDDATYGRCPNGDTLGLNLLSELYVLSASFDGSDFVTTTQFRGTRRGMLRPEQMLIVSPQLWQALKGGKLRGCDFEICRLV